MSFLPHIPHGFVNVDAELHHATLTMSLDPHDPRNTPGQFTARLHQGSSVTAVLERPLATWCALADLMRRAAQPGSTVPRHLILEHDICDGDVMVCVMPLWDSHGRLHMVAVDITHRDGSLRLTIHPDHHGDAMTAVDQVTTRLTDMARSADTSETDDALDLIGEEDLQ